MKTKFSLEWHIQEFLALLGAVSLGVQTTFEPNLADMLGLVYLALALLCHEHGSEGGEWDCPALTMAILTITCHAHGLS